MAREPVHDEARHVEVFTKRALAGGARGYALASTELSLHTLLDEHDFSAAALLLNVLGEGTFLDLLRFVERHAPDGRPPPLRVSRTATSGAMSSSASPTSGDASSGGRRSGTGSSPRPRHGRRS